MSACEPWPVLAQYFFFNYGTGLARWPVRWCTGVAYARMTVDRQVSNAVPSGNVMVARASNEFPVWAPHAHGTRRLRTVRLAVPPGLPPPAPTASPSQEWAPKRTAAGDVRGFYPPPIYSSARTHSRMWQIIPCRSPAGSLTNPSSPGLT